MAFLRFCAHVRSEYNLSCLTSPPLYSSGPSSVGVDYGYCVSLKMVFVPQRQWRLWLISPMREWQSLPHWLQMWQVGMTPGMRAFLLALFSLAVVRIFSSPDFNYLRRTLRHLPLSAAASSQLSLYTILKALPAISSDFQQCIAGDGKSKPFLKGKQRLFFKPQYKSQIICWITQVSKGLLPTIVWFSHLLEKCKNSTLF